MDVCYHIDVLKRLLPFTALVLAHLPLPAADTFVTNAVMTCRTYEPGSEIPLECWAPEGLKDGSTGRIRVKEEENACRLLGATPHFLSEVDGCACAGQPSVDLLVGLLRQYRPKAVFTHWPLDRHSDHVQTAAVVFNALDLVRRELQPEFYFFEVSLGQTRNWHPLYHVDVTSTIGNKLTMLRKYECQNDGDGLAGANRKRAALRGRQRTPSCAFAETFTTFDGKPIEGGVLSSLGELVVTRGDAPYPRE